MFDRIRLVLLLVGGLGLGGILGLLILFGSDWLTAWDGFIAQNEDALQSSAPIVGQSAPDFKTQLLDGEEIHLSDYTGKIVFLNFWATWCAPCRSEMPAFQEIFDNEGSNIVVLAINAGEAETEITEFVDELGLTFPVGFDQNGEIQRQYRVVGLPVSFMIDENGIIRALHVGLMTEGQLNGYLELMGAAN
jgi:cytochrome c biogenesis protein CcmG, thiol:disulfide interchange protein DsbE